MTALTLALPGVADAQLLTFPRNQRDDGVLTVYQSGAELPFACARTFAITGVPQGGVRGRHAHKACVQLLVALTGRVEVMWTDGVEQRTVLLDDPGKGLLVPAGLWVELTFLTADACVIVPCDHPFDPDDYLRDWDGFLAWRRGR